MAVRVKVRINVQGKVIETSALVNSGFETDEPQILVPDRLLTLNGIDVSKLGAGRAVEYGTAGGDIAMYVVKRACTVSILEPDRVVGSVTSDLVISPIEREVLISDALGEELGIVILSLKKGLWRFSNDPEGTVRRSYPPEYW